MAYRELDHTADILLEISGNSIHELFCEAARALMDVLYPPTHNVKNSSTNIALTTVPITVSIDAKDSWSNDVNSKYREYEHLVQAFLSELLFLTETEYLVFLEFDIAITKTKVSGTVRGVPFDPLLHSGGIGVKGISYYDLAITKAQSGYHLSIIYDI